MIGLFILLGPPPTRVKAEAPVDEAKYIEINEPQEPLDKRLQRKITLDIRDMNIVDVIKFLATKGEFNVVTSSKVEGRVTLLLKSVAIKDALDIAVISNHLAYKILPGDIVQVMNASEYEATYGRIFGDKTEVRILQLNYAKPANILAALDNIKSSIGKIIIDEDTGSLVLIDTPEALAKMQDALKTLETPLNTYIFTMEYAKAEVVGEKLRSRIDASGVGSIMADERSNQLIVRALPSRLEEIKTMIKGFDAPTKEVMIEARILQVTFKPTFDLGIDWNLDFKDSPDPQLRKISFQNLYLNNPKLSTSDNLGNAFGKIGIGQVNADHFSVAARALKQVSDTKILSNPQIMVTNNEEARIHIGDTIPYIISTTSGTGDNAITSEDVRFVDVGLKLAVTPIINDDGVVIMRLKPEISTVVDKIQSKGGGIPQTNKTEVETTVMVKDGMTIIMGGLKKDDKVHTKKGLPYLMDVPWVGKFFSRVSDNIASTEIVIFITPHVVTSKDDYNSLKGSVKPFKDYKEASVEPK